MHSVARFVGYTVMLLWLLGALGLGDFVLRFGPVADRSRVDGKNHTCHDGEGLLMRRKYSCDSQEFAAREAAGINGP